VDPTPLDYQRPEPFHRRPPSLAELLVCAVLAAVALSTCVRVEWLNARAGHYLPRLPQDTGPWRQMPETQASFRLVQRTFDPTLAWRPLSPEEHRAVRQFAARNRLRDLVASWGLVQYAIVPLVLAWSASVFLRPRTPITIIVAALCGIAALACAASMFHRGYLTSLGWS
jgi:hypothetical protein